MKLDITSVLVRPHITEKATVSSENSVYVFEVSKEATKDLIEKAFNLKYKVFPLKVRTVTIPAKRVIVRGKRGTKASYKKAYIYVKKGEKVEII